MFERTRIAMTGVFMKAPFWRKLKSIFHYVRYRGVPIQWLIMEFFKFATHFNISLEWPLEITF